MKSSIEFGDYPACHVWWHQRVNNVSPGGRNQVGASHPHWWLVRSSWLLTCFFCWLPIGSAVWSSKHHNCLWMFMVLMPWNHRVCLWIPMKSPWLLVKWHTIILWITIHECHYISIKLPFFHVFSWYKTLIFLGFSPMNSPWNHYQIPIFSR